jgi:hypothetical protein
MFYEVGLGDDPNTAKILSWKDMHLFIRQTIFIPLTALQDLPGSVQPVS